MDQLPNYHKKYYIFDFAAETGKIFVSFPDAKYAAWLVVPRTENNMYITGYDLDNYIMSFCPPPPTDPETDPDKELKKEIPENSDYIRSLINDRFRLTDEFIRVRTQVLTRRAIALQSSDWTQLPDVQEQMTEEDRQLWKRFRQELRDITKQPGFPKKLNWPQRPYIMGTIIYE
jgi:hypothetical protein